MVEADGFSIVQPEAARHALLVARQLVAVEMERGRQARARPLPEHGRGLLLRRIRCDLCKARYVVVQADALVHHAREEWVEAALDPVRLRQAGPAEEVVIAVVLGAGAPAFIGKAKFEGRAGFPHELVKVDAASVQSLDQVEQAAFSHADDADVGRFDHPDFDLPREHAAQCQGCEPARGPAADDDGAGHVAKIQHASGSMDMVEKKGTPKGAPFFVQMTEMPCWIQISPSVFAESMVLL
nr:hypothetical protein [Variovorax sp. efr-133-TYG-130]